MSIELLLPDSSAMQAYDGQPKLGIGAIAVVPTPICFDDFTSLTEIASSSPWVPIGLVRDPDESRPILAGRGEPLPNRLLVVQKAPAEELIAAITRAIDTRLPPSASQIATYFDKRVPSLGSWVLDAILDEPWKRHRVRRALHDIGGWTPADCRRLYRCIGGFTAGNAAVTQERAAGLLGVNRKTLSRWTAGFFGLRHEGARRLRAWEALAECALRSSGIISD
jgi:hypothetical protein